MEAATAADPAMHAEAVSPSSEKVAAAGNSVPRNAVSTPRKSRKVRTFWLKQLHTWHWISAAVSLAAMLLFAITGITLNHASSIAAEPVVTKGEGKLPPRLLRTLQTVSDSTAPLPADVAKGVAAAVPLDPTGFAADWSGEDEVYVAMPGPGRDAWVSIDRATGEVTSEKTARGAISYINDLHKGRNTGSAWFWFIDVFAVACLVFTLTGLILLQLHAKHRPSTWPLVGLSVAIPVAIAIFFIH